ncbi:uncharacterized protein LOC135352321 [Halichondria panicea]|uniref:uncharacterized protein LOC135352321 n=1 Tax=Halichondria panicea TaxID=6063 RepID=UPI00312BAFBC
MIGAKVLAVHYSLLQDIGIQVPAAIAVGNVSLGKTRSAEAALSLVGMDTVSKVKSITDVKAIKFGSLTSLGMIIDDPSQPSQVSEKLLFHFDRGTRATTTSFDAPKTTFLTSMNTTCLQALSSMDPRYITRAVLVPFEESGHIEAARRVDADRKLKRIMAKEAGKAVGVVISMGKFFKSPEADNFFKHIVTRVEHLMPDNTCHRLLVSYSWLLGATFKILSVANVLKPEAEEMIWKYFENTMVPIITKYQLEPMEAQVDLTKEDIQRVLCSSVAQQPSSTVLTFVRNISSHQFAINVGQLRKHNESMGKSLSSSFKSALTNLFRGSIKPSVPQLFLKPGVNLPYVQTGIKGRKSPNNVYVRSFVIQKSSLSNDTVAKLEKASSELKQTPASSSQQIPASSSQQTPAREAHQSRNVRQTAAVTLKKKLYSPAKLCRSPKKKRCTTPHLSLSLNGSPSSSEAELYTPLNRSHQLHRTMMKLSLLHGPTLLSIPHYTYSSKEEKRETSANTKRSFYYSTPINKHSVAALKQSFSPICHKIKPRKLQKHFEGSRHDADKKTSISSITQRAHQDPPMLELQQKVSPEQQITAIEVVDSVIKLKKIPEDEKHCQQCGGKFTKKGKGMWVGCEADSCWRWYHYTCVGLKELPFESQVWICPSCHPPAGKLSVIN